MRIKVNILTSTDVQNTAAQSPYFMETAQLLRTCHMTSHNQLEAVTPS